MYNLRSCFLDIPLKQTPEECRQNVGKTLRDFSVCVKGEGGGAGGQSVFLREKKGGELHDRWTHVAAQDNGLAPLSFSEL